MATMVQNSITNPATPDMKGRKALLIKQGEDPIEVIINKVDVASGLIIEVIFKDENKEAKILEVKDQIVMFAPWIVRFVISIVNWFKSRKKSKE